MSGYPHALATHARAVGALARGRGLCGRTQSHPFSVDLADAKIRSTRQVCGARRAIDRLEATESPPVSGVAELHTLRRGAEREHVPGRTGDWDDWEDCLGLGAGSRCRPGLGGLGTGKLGTGFTTGREDWGLGNWELGLELPPPLAVFFRSAGPAGTGPRRRSGKKQKQQARAGLVGLGQKLDWENWLTQFDWFAPVPAS